MLLDRGSLHDVCAIICLGFAIRSIVSLYPYSGKGVKPMYGDYEAQRHWQEITVNLPISQWYRNSSKNDLMYWGLDYPPLTAYHSWLIGKVASKCNEKFIELESSRGFESEKHKHFMRITVLVADLLIYIPAICLAVNTFTKFKKDFSKKLWNSARLNHLLIFLLFPGQILIDNGHFQYNNISLGFTLLAIICILENKNLLGSIMFSLALNYKQMELYHAIPFFVYLLRLSITKSYFKSFVSLSKIGTVVLLTFLLLWLPWIISLDVPSVIHRIFPLARGVFEDKVSNFWCILNVFVKIKQIISNEKMALICLFTTFICVLPNCLHLFLYPDKLNFVYSLLNTSLGFFLFSYQVHEKSILLPALPTLLLLPIEPTATLWFLQVSAFSMVPLLIKDGLLISYVATTLIFFGLSNILVKDNTNEKFSTIIKYSRYLSYLMGISLVLCHLYAPIIDRLPHLYTFLISFYSFIHFLLFKIYFNYKQFCRCKN